MTLAEKLARLRKQKNWSQEELAEKVGVTRQAVSKWESAQSAPDLEKIVQLSALFGVSTDYLLKEELAAEAPAPKTEAPEARIRRVPLGEAKRFMQTQTAQISKMSLGVALCVWSPIVLIGLGAANDRLPSSTAAGIGLCALLMVVAAGVALLLTAGGRLREFEYLDREPIAAEPDAKAFAKTRQEALSPVITRQTTIGVVLCIVSALPIFAVLCLPRLNDSYYSLAVCALLVLVGIACLLLVRAGMLRGGVDRLLEQGDFTRGNKARSRLTGALSAAYWLVVTAVFFFYTFGPNGNGQPQYSWFIWAIAGVLYGALMAILSVCRKKSK